MSGATNRPVKWRDLLEQWGLTNLKLTFGFAEFAFQPRDPDRNAAWDLYVELATRITTQPLLDDEGDEKTALDSVYAVFDMTRTILKANRGATEFAKIAIVVLNQVIRPFTAKWHTVAIAGKLSDPAHKSEFRSELKALREVLGDYARLLGDMAMVGADLVSVPSRVPARAGPLP